MDSVVITIDGPAGAGKTTAARRLAERLGLEYLDTGAGYRVAALAMQHAGLTPATADATLADFLRTLTIELQGTTARLNGNDVSQAIRAPAVSQWASQIAERPAVREFFKSWQRGWAQGRRFVTEGRDQGTAVFPHAGCKFYLEADPEERVDRRFRELCGRGQEISRADVRAQQQERDQRDMTRAIDRLEPAADAVRVNSTHMTIDDVVDFMARHIRERLGL